MNPAVFLFLVDKYIKTSGRERFFPKELRNSYCRSLRKTPVAVSTVDPVFIEEKLGSQEFPEILKSTPAE